MAIRVSQGFQAKDPFGLSKGKSPFGSQLNSPTADALNTPAPEQHQAPIQPDSALEPAQPTPTAQSNVVVDEGGRKRLFNPINIGIPETPSSDVAPVSEQPALRPDQQFLQERAARIAPQNEQTQQFFNQLDGSEPGRYRLIDARDYSSWKKDYDANQPGMIEDALRLLGGSSIEGTAQAVRGLGEATRAIADVTTTPLINAIFGTDFKSVNPLNPPADVAASYGEKMKEGISFATKDALLNSTPGGSFVDPSTWTLGENPSFRGYAALTLDVFGSMTPIIVASVLSGGAGGVLVGGAQGGGAAADQARQTIDYMATQPGMLEKESAYYRELMARGFAHDDAVLRTKEAAAKTAFTFAAPIAGAGGGLTSKLINPATKILAGRNIMLQIAGRAGASALEEGTQEAAETMATELGINVAAGTNRDITDGTFGDFILGALAGGATGAGAGANAGIADMRAGRVTEDTGALSQAVMQGQDRTPTAEITPQPVRDDTKARKPDPEMLAQQAEESAALNKTLRENPQFAEGASVTVNDPELGNFNAIVDSVDEGGVLVFDGNGDLLLIEDPTNVLPPQGEFVAEGYGAEQFKQSAPVQDFAPDPVEDLIARQNPPIREPLPTPEGPTPLEQVVSKQTEAMPETVDASPTQRSFGEKTVTFPDQEHADMYDLGEKVRNARYNSTLPAEKVLEAELTELADRLDITKEDALKVVDDYRVRTDRAAKAKDGDFTMPIFGTGRLGDMKKAKTRADTKAVAETVEQQALAAPETTVDAQAQEAATSPLNDDAEPTQAQKEAGNYKVGKVRLGGQDISIENPAGSQRKGVDPNGKEWSVTMKSHYGYFKGTIGKDKDHIDTFIKPGTSDVRSSDPVFVIDQINDKGAFDEHKVMVGYKTLAQAKRAYLANYDKGWQGLGKITKTPMGGLRLWFKNGDTTKPFKPALAPEKAAAREAATVEEKDVAPASETDAPSKPSKITRMNTTTANRIAIKDVFDAIGKDAADKFAQMALDGAKNGDYINELDKHKISGEIADSGVKYEVKSKALKITHENPDGEVVTKTVRGKDLAIDIANRSRDLVNRTRKQDRYGDIVIGDKLADGTSITHAAEKLQQREAEKEKVKTKPKDSPLPKVDTENEGQSKSSQESPKGETPPKETDQDDGSDKDEKPQAQFAGQKSETADHNLLKEAIKMLAAGRSSDFVRNKTGWFRSADNLWRYEISDKDASLDDALNSGYVGVYGELANNWRHNNATFMLSELLEHDKLYAAYPDLRSVPVTYDITMYSIGSVDGVTGELRLNPKLVKNTKDLLSTLMHEVQHLIQRREGFARGGNLTMTEQIRSALKDFADNRSFAVDVWRDKNAGLFEDLDEKRKLSQYIGLYRDFDSLIAYSNSDKPSSVFRHIRSKATWLHSDVFRNHADADISKRANDMYRKLYELPKPSRMQARNSFLSDYSFGLAQLLRDSVPKEAWDKFKADERQTKSIEKALDRDASKAREALEPYEAFRRKAAKAQGLELNTRYKNAHQIYSALAGEVEARNTQTRIEMTDAERQLKSPEETEDTPQSHVIVVMPDGEIETSTMANMGDALNVSEHSKVKQSQLEDLKKIIAKVGGVKDVEIADSLLIENPEGWDMEGPAQVAGLYYPVSDLIVLAADEADTRTAYHESFHRLQNLYLTNAEKTALKANAPMLRRIVKSDPEFASTVKGMSQSELEAEAFAIYADNKGKFPSPKGIRGAWNRIADLIDKVKAYFKGENIALTGDLFAAAARGDVAKRTKRTKPSLSNIEPAPKVNTKAFKDWFGDSKVVDENGKPLVVYHGTRNKFTEFQSGAYSEMGGSVGIFFSDNHDVAANYAGSADEATESEQGVHSVYLKVDNLFEYDAQGANWAELDKPVIWVVRDKEGDVIQQYEHERDAEVFVDDYNDDFVEEYGIEPKEYGEITLKQEFDEDGEGRTTDDIFDEAMENGFDGVLIKNVIDVGGEGAETLTDPSNVYIVKDPKQIKSVANKGSFDPENPNVLARPVPNKLPKNIKADGIIAAVTQELKGKWTDMSPSLLSMVPLNYFEELAQPNMTAVKDYMRHKLAMDTFRGDQHAKADVIAQSWLKYVTSAGGYMSTKSDKTRAEHLSQLMHESTLAGVDPSSTAEAHVTAPQYAELRARYEALPPKGKELYKQVRDGYKAQSKELDAIILENIKKTQDIAQRRAQRDFEKGREKLARKIENATKKGNAERLAELNQEMDDLLERFKKDYARAKSSGGARLIKMRKMFEQTKASEPYFPLARTGEYFVSVRDEDGDVISFSRREKAIERDKLAAQMQKEFPDARVESGVLESGGADTKDAMDPRMVGDIQKILGDAGVDDQVMDMVWQRYLETMPDLSTRKRFIHRKGTAGFDADALKAFSKHMFHASHQMARLKYGMDLQEATNEAMDQAKISNDPTKGVRLANQLNKNHKWVMNPTGSAFGQKMNSTAFIWFLGVTPAAALVNLTQTPMMGIPIIGARFGMANAAIELAKAGKDTTLAKNNITESKNLTKAERMAVEEFFRTGLIDKTQSHDLAGVGDTGVDYSPILAKSMERIGYLFHNAEVWNRQVTALAAYRAGVKAGLSHRDAIETAHDLTWKTHFDYSNSSRPTVLQNDFAKVALVFRAHSINMIYRIVRDVHQSFKGDTPQQRAIARKQLIGVFGMLQLFAGTTGLFGFNQAMWILNMMFGDDDDPLDFETRMKKDLIDVLGPQLGGIILNGAPGYYTKTDLTSRIGLADIWFRSSYRDLEGSDQFQDWLLQSTGAGASMVGNWFKATDYILKGQFADGVEVGAPKFVRDLMRGYRRTKDGVVSAYSGNQIISQEDLSLYENIIQGAGFSPASVSETWERNSALRRAETSVMRARRKLLNKYALAYSMRDQEAMADIIEDIKKFNRGKANRGLAITGETLKKSMAARARNANKREDGVIIQNEILGHQLRSNLPARINE